jgi:hypothetical protein
LQQIVDAADGKRMVVSVTASLCRRSRRCRNAAVHADDSVSELQERPVCRAYDLALLRGGVSPADWTVNDFTGDPFYEELLTQRLANNGLANEGTDVLRITGAGRWASWLG